MAKIKRIEGIKALLTLNEAEYRELLDLVGNRVFKAGMGAEAVWELLEKVDLDKLAQEPADRTPGRRPGSAARRRPSACAWSRRSASPATSRSGW